MTKSFAFLFRCMGMLLTFWMLSSGTGFAQRGVVRGVVYAQTGDGGEAAVRTPLPGASVYWAGTSYGVLTDSAGRFALKRVQERSRLVVRFVGMQADTFAAPRKGQMLEVVLRSGSLDTVTIRSHQSSIRLSLVDPRNVSILTSGELRKAACCNLSESFETNASIDASFTDAVTGTRQIRMLGLAGTYVQIMEDNIPALRGLAAINGMGWTPGPWLNSIQLSKGAASVANGYESITGQLNLNLHKPKNSEGILLEGYSSARARLEGNAIWSGHWGRNWGTTVRLHAGTRRWRFDQNEDGFMDMPLDQKVRAAVHVQFLGDNGLGTQWVVDGLQWRSVAGQLDYQADRDRGLGQLYGVEQMVDRIGVNGKFGYVFPDKPWMSLGSQVSGVLHRQVSWFGSRRYVGDQNSLLGNLLFQTQLGSPVHELKLGGSFLLDEVSELLGESAFYRQEVVPGLFTEYTFLPDSRWSVIGGVRGDWHNLFGFFVTPRMHARYLVSEETSLKVSAGRGQRTASIFAENPGVMASSRVFQLAGARGNLVPGSAGSAGGGFPGGVGVLGTTDAQAYGLDPEVAWNFGFNVTQKFRLDYREGSVVLDLYHTRFENQIVVDRETSPQLVVFSNLEGTSYSSSALVEVNYELARRLDIRMAYRFLDARTDYVGSGFLQVPFQAQHRGFLNVAYGTKGTMEGRDRWLFDVTAQWIGPQRIPATASNPGEFQLAGTSPAFFLLAGQVRRLFLKDWEIFFGGENLTNYRIPGPIVAAGDPFGRFFDSSMVWGPVFGLNAYVGVRLVINRGEEGKGE